jgi:hypothetical protein
MKEGRTCRKGNAGKHRRGNENRVGEAHGQLVFFVTF